MSVMLVLDVIIITLLIAAVIYAVILDNHLSATKQNYRMLSHLIDQFYQASQRMQEELTSIQKSEREMKQELMNQIDKAAILKEELSNLINRIDQKTHMMENLKIRRYNLSPEPSPSLNANDLDLSDSERELLNALNELKV